ncbi:MULTISPECIES: tryptophan halogenase family protein [Calothrix]|uniref:Tryptophan 7-halogenase n=2 Tax=Calothrix TaxID=1186 RepID=A0ABR8AF37_9CYAN|nr:MULTISPECIES: tryptophan halogenase family protein [Calothrix]MBD2198650.1 tryptophan 7-halogenase [Calothrix parietina FACHB-288]MBD2227053.1 tryptophan 7-halogenase [Calothrix anomala FACHB-343]
MNIDIKRVAIVGGSSAGLLSAVTLKHFFPQLQVLLIYSRKHAAIGVGESTTAWFPQFLHEHLNIPQEEFYKSIWPVWKLGIKFEWGVPNIAHFNYTFDRQFRYDSQSLSKTPGFYCMHDMRQASRYSILMDRQHSPLLHDGQGNIKILADGFGYHIDVYEFIKYLAMKASSLGVDIQEMEVIDAKLDEQGNVQYLCCEDDLKIEADLFIDCSGFKSQLLRGVLKEEFISFSHRLFCDSAIVGNWKRQSPIFPFTTATTMNSGWRWRIDLRERVSFGYVYSSSFCTQDEAIQEYLSLTPEATDDLRKISFKSGRYRRFWVNNVVAIGNASGFVEPLESTGQHMIVETIWRVVLALQDSNLRPTPKLINATNQYVADLWDEICDFLTLHFKFNRKLDTPFWKYCQEKTDLGSVQNLVELYQDSGVCRAIAHLIPKSSIFEIDGYLTILCGQQVPVKHLKPLTERESSEWLQYRQTLHKNLEGSLNPQEAFHLLEKIW